jgi:hypothetical protein
VGIVSEYLRDLVARQVNERGIVVWFDPEGHYRTFAEALSLPDTAVAHYEGSFLALRHQVDALLEGESPPRLVVYVPLAEEATQNALIELIAAGATLKPGHAARPRNTRLSVVAKGALREKLVPQELAEIEKQVEEGKLSLADLDRLAEQGGSGVLVLLFGKSDPQHVALSLLSSTRYDADIQTKQAEAEIARLLKDAYGLDLPPDKTLEEWRLRLARHLLCTDLLASLSGPLPPQLATLHVAPDEWTRAACLDLARTWRRLRDLDESYLRYASQVEQELGLAGITFTLEQISQCETFAALEQALQTAVESWLLIKLADVLVALIQQRKTGYWSTHLPEVAARWELLLVAAHLLMLAEQIEAALKPATLSAADLFRAYTEGEHPWCELDTLQRRMEYRRFGFDFDAARHATLLQVVHRARQRYTEVGGLLAERFVRALAQDRFRLKDVPTQRETFSRVVAPALRKSKTAYLLVDALRFELARELVRDLGEGYRVTLTAAMGTVPSITQIGMAALMPGAEGEAQLVPTGPDKVGLKIGETVLKDRKSRIEWLKQHAPEASTSQQASIFVTRLEDFPFSKKDIHAGIEAADLVVMTSQELDALGETDNVLLARTTMDNILINLRRAIRKLAELGCQRIIVSADHGYLLGDELGEDMKLDAPGGETLDLHRRVWVGRGGAEGGSAFLRVPLVALGLSQDATLELAVPWGFAGFKASGGTLAYFHGGMAPQEIVVPVVEIVPSARAATAAEGEIVWTLTLGSKKISTRFCTVQISGQSQGLFDAMSALPRVRVEIREGKDELSTAIAATYGFSEATHDVQLAFADEASRDLASNTVTLMLTQEPSQPTTHVSIHVLDAVTGRELARLEPVELTLAI